MPKHENDFYLILGVAVTASLQEIAKAYRKLILQYHPDRNLDNREEAEAKTKLFNAAYEVLSDPVKREAYNQEYSAQFPSQSVVNTILVFNASDLMSVSAPVFSETQELVAMERVRFNLTQVIKEAGLLPAEIVKIGTENLDFGYALLFSPMTSSLNLKEVFQIYAAVAKQYFRDVSCDQTKREALLKFPKLINFLAEWYQFDFLEICKQLPDLVSGMLANAAITDELKEGGYEYVLLVFARLNLGIASQLVRESRFVAQLGISNIVTLIAHYGEVFEAVVMEAVDISLKKKLAIFQDLKAHKGQDQDGIELLWNDEILISLAKDDSSVALEIANYIVDHPELVADEFCKKLIPIIAVNKTAALLLWQLSGWDQQALVTLSVCQKEIALEILQGKRDVQNQYLVNQLPASVFFEHIRKHELVGDLVSELSKSDCNPELFLKLTGGELNRFVTLCGKEKFESLLTLSDAKLAKKYQAFLTIQDAVLQQNTSLERASVQQLVTDAGMDIWLLKLAQQSAYLAKTLFNCGYLGEKYFGQHAVHYLLKLAKIHEDLALCLIDDVERDIYLVMELSCHEAVRTKIKQSSHLRGKWQNLVDLLEAQHAFKNLDRTQVEDVIKFLDSDAVQYIDAIQMMQLGVIDERIVLHVLEQQQKFLRVLTGEVLFKFWQQYGFSVRAKIKDTPCEKVFDSYVLLLRVLSKKPVDHAYSADNVDNQMFFAQDSEDQYQQALDAIANLTFTEQDNPALLALILHLLDSAAKQKHAAAIEKLKELASQVKHPQFSCAIYFILNGQSESSAEALQWLRNAVILGSQAAQKIILADSEEGYQAFIVELIALAETNQDVMVCYVLYQLLHQRSCLQLSALDWLCKAAEHLSTAWNELKRLAKQDKHIYERLVEVTHKVPSASHYYDLFLEADKRQAWDEAEDWLLLAAQLREDYFTELKVKNDKWYLESHPEYINKINHAIPDFFDKYIVRLIGWLNTTPSDSELLFKLGALLSNRLLEEFNRKSTPRLFDPLKAANYLKQACELGHQSSLKLLINLAQQDTKTYQGCYDYVLYEYYQAHGNLELAQSSLVSAFEKGNVEVINGYQAFHLNPTIEQWQKVEAMYRLPDKTLALCCSEILKHTKDDYLFFFNRAADAYCKAVAKTENVESKEALFTELAEQGCIYATKYLDLDRVSGAQIEAWVTSASKKVSECKICDKQEFLSCMQEVAAKVENKTPEFEALLMKQANLKGDKTQDTSKNSKKDVEQVAASNSEEDVEQQLATSYLSLMEKVEGLLGKINNYCAQRTKEMQSFSYRFFHDANLTQIKLQNAKDLLDELEKIFSKLDAGFSKVIREDSLIDLTGGCAGALQGLLASARDANKKSETSHHGRLHQLFASKNQLGTILEDGVKTFNFHPS